jgi:RNA polymerase sigma-54 factor
VNGLKKRNETLLNVARHIIKMQMDFLDAGVEFMRPMNITDISTVLELHESTVSRVTTGKYISTPRGVFELKYFFPSHVMKESGETCSAISVKSLIQELISKETANHIFSDNDIVSCLKEKGINIARRTVAKYRESMNILSSYQRQMKRDASFSDDAVGEIELESELNPA